jgi:hypothetical protein
MICNDKHHPSGVVLFLKGVKHMHYTLRGKIAKAHPYQLDNSLTVPGAAAEAEATGKAIEEAKKQSKVHIDNRENPHNVTKQQVGLGLVDNTSDMDKPVSTAQAEAISEAKKAGTDAQIAADNAQTAADNAQTAADNAQTAADNAQTAADNALTASKDYTDSKHLSLTAKLSDEWKGKIVVIEKTDEDTGEVWKTEKETAPYTQKVEIEGILKDDYPHVTPVYSEDEETALMEEETWSMVSDADTADGSITFICFKDKPETAITVQIEVNR